MSVQHDGPQPGSVLTGQTRVQRLAAPIREFISTQNSSARDAGEIGVDVERFERDLSARHHALRVLRDTTSAEESAATGTPTFFINGRRHHGPYDLQTLEAALQLVLRSG